MIIDIFVIERKTKKMAKFEELDSINSRLELVRSKISNEKSEGKKPWSTIEREKQSLLTDALNELIEGIRKQNWLSVVFNFGKFIMRLVLAIKKIRQVLAT